MLDTSTQRDSSIACPTERKCSLTALGLGKHQANVGTLRDGLFLKGLSRLGVGESGGMGFLEGDQAAGELEEGKVVGVFLRPADQDRAVAVEP